MAGTNDDYVRRLRNDGRQDLLDKIESGEMSVYAAAMQMGYRKSKSKQSRSDQIEHHWRRASIREKVRFLELNWESVAPMVANMHKAKRDQGQAQKPSE